MKQLVVKGRVFENKMLAYRLTADGYGVTSASQNRSERHPPAGI